MLNASKYELPFSLVRLSSPVIHPALSVSLQALVTTKYNEAYEQGIFPPPLPPPSGAQRFSSAEPQNASSPANSLPDSGRRKRARTTRESTAADPFTTTASKPPPNSSSMATIIRARKALAPGIQGISDLVDYSDPVVIDSKLIIDQSEAETEKLESYGPEGWWELSLDEAVNKDMKFKAILNDLKGLKDSRFVLLSSHPDMLLVIHCGFFLRGKKWIPNRRNLRICSYADRQPVLDVLCAFQGLGVESWLLNTDDLVCETYSSLIRSRSSRDRLTLEGTTHRSRSMST